MSDVRIRGKVVNVGGTDYVVPPFNLDHLEQLGKHERKDGEPKMTLVEEIKAFGPILASNVKRNYPDLDTEAFMKEIDVVNFLELTLAGWGKERPAPFPQAPAQSESQ